MRLRSQIGIVLGSALAAAALAGCSPQPSSADDALSVVASTNVYGELARMIGGADVTVTSIISDPSQDPHSYVATARDQLALSKADIVIENGGGYDAFIDQMLSSLDVPEQLVLNAVELSPLGLDARGNEHAGDSFNEHVWYDFPTVAALVDELSEALAARDPAHGARYESNAAALTGDLDALSERASAIHSAHGGTRVAITESVPLYLLEAAGLHNVTPAEFSEAIEEGSEVSAALLNETLGLFSNGAAKVLVYNDQTTSPETETLLVAAENAGVPTVSVTELLPAGAGYVDWMSGILDSLEAALERA